MNLNIRGYTFCKNAKFHQHSFISDELISEVITEELEYIEDCIKRGKYNISITHDFGFVIGTTHCVECPRGVKDVYFEKRGNRPYLSRMVKGRVPEETSLCTIIIRYDNSSNCFFIISAWVGPQAKPELGNITYFENCANPLEEIMVSAEFWLNHALIKEK